MGRGRPVEPFHRPYSPPEPPAPARRPKRFVVLAAVAALTTAGAALYLLVLGRDGQDAAVRSAPAKARIVETLPPPCATVSQATVDRAVPKATRRQNANSTLTARVRNAVFTVSYGERASGDRTAQDGRARACLTTVTAVAREVLTSLTHF